MDNLVTEPYFAPKVFLHKFLFRTVAGDRRKPPRSPRVSEGGGGAAGAEFAKLKHRFQL